MHVALPVITLELKSMTVDHILGANAVRCGLSTLEQPYSGPPKENGGEMNRYFLGVQSLFQDNVNRCAWMRVVWWIR